MAVSFNSSGFGGSASGDEDTAQLSVLADAIKKMDGLIGDFRPASPDVPEPVLSSDPTVLAIVDLSEQLAHLVTRLKQLDTSSESDRDTPHPRECVPASVQETIISWLGGINLEETQQLIHDKEELLGQVVSLQQQLEASRGECLKLSVKVSSAEKRCVEKEQQLRDLTEEMRLTKISMSTKEVELRHLQDQIQAGYRTDKLERGGSKQVSFSSSTKPESALHRRSFRRALKKAFGKKDRNIASLKTTASQKWPSNPRAESFTAKTSAELAEWFKTIALDMYSDLAEEKMLTGESLAELVAEDSSLVHVGILSTLHCKKLKLAVLDALSEQPSCLAQLNHEWVGQWLVDIGLPQFQRLFLDARFDGLMLNNITLEDLKLLDVVVPFHVASIKRSLQAFRMCGYGKDYLKDTYTEKKLGSQKLLRWSAKDVSQWVCSIELDEYVGAMETMGINGAVMLLDVRFSSDSLARALGINQSKTLIRKHLSKKFMELIGPVAAQNKVDAMQNKSYVPLDPTETPTTFNRHRSRSVGNRRGKGDKEVSQPLLPMDQFPAPSNQSPAPSSQFPAPSGAVQGDLPRVASTGGVRDISVSPPMEPPQQHQFCDESFAEATRYPTP